MCKTKARQASARYTLRCTAKLLKRLGPPVEGAGEPPTNRLGDWFATLVHAPRMQLVLMVSERTLPPIVVPAPFPAVA